MTRKFDKNLKALFKTEHLEPGLFHHFPSSLRFNLSCDGTYTEMFSRAMQRAKTLFESVFGHSATISIDLVFWRENNSPNEKPYNALHECGFLLPHNHERKIINMQSDDPDDMGYMYHYSFETTGYDQNIHALLWAIMSNELGIKPTANLKSYFADFDKGILFHPYDDRGLDIIASNKEILLPLYEQHHKWISSHHLMEIQKRLL